LRAAVPLQAGHHHYYYRINVSLSQYSNQIRQCPRREVPPSIQSLSMDMKTERLGTTSLLWLPTSWNASIPTATRTSSRNQNSRASRSSKRKRIHHKQSMQALSYTAMPLMN